METIFTTTTLDFAAVKRSLETVQLSDVVAGLRSDDPAALEATQHKIRKILDVELLNGHTSTFAVFLALVSDLSNKNSWEDLQLRYTEKTRLYEGELIARVCACGKNDCLYMGVFHGELGNLLLGSTCITKIGITPKKELAKQQRELKLRGLCKKCAGKVDPRYDTCFACKFPNTCIGCGKRCGSKYATCYACH